LKNDGLEVEFEISKLGGALQEPLVKGKKKVKKLVDPSNLREGAPLTDPPISPMVTKEDT
jgi:hypothetical protein